MLLPRSTWFTLALTLSACVDAADAGPDGACDLAALVPGLGDVFPSPRANGVAEVLALSCADGIAAPAPLYSTLASELATIAAVDARMRLDRNVDPWIYPFHSNLLTPPMLVADADDLEAARAVFDPDTCAHAVTVALHGAATEIPPGAHDPHLTIAFPGRLHPDVLVHSYAALGIPIRSQSVSVGDGSRAAFRETPAGREYLLELRGGDCPAGCTSARSFWWRVAEGRAELLGEWGQGLDARTPGAWEPPPAGFDPTGFACAKCPDGRATREVIERDCDDGRDDDCDRVIDCADPDCADVVPCRPEACDNAVDDDADGRIDCDDPDCATALACGARTACEAIADQTFLAKFAPSGVLGALDRHAASCEQHEAPPDCFHDFFADNGVSAQCGACLGDVGLCIVERCPWIGSTEEAHATCVEQCAPLLEACAPE